MKTSLWVVLREHDHGADAYILQIEDGVVPDGEYDEAVASALGIDIEGDILTYAPLNNLNTDKNGHISVDQRLFPTIAKIRV